MTNQEIVKHAILSGQVLGNKDLSRNISFDIDTPLYDKRQELVLAYLSGNQELAMAILKDAIEACINNLAEEI